MTDEEAYSDKLPLARRLFAVLISCLAAEDVNGMRARLFEVIQTADAKDAQELGKVVRTFVMQISEEIYNNSGLTPLSAQSILGMIKLKGKWPTL